MMESRLPSSRQHQPAPIGKRWDAVKGNDTSQGRRPDPSVKLPHGPVVEYSAQNARNWNYNNQSFNNNNKNNNNSLCAVRDSVGVDNGCAVTLQDLYQAYVDCRRRKKRKKGAKAFDPYALHTLCNIRDEINERRYKLKASTCFVVKYPVPREVFCAAFRDRIVQHFVYNELNPVIDRMLIQDTASCRLNKGTDYAIERAERFLRRETDNYKNIDGVWIEKLDLSGFFMSIDRHILLQKVLHVVNYHYEGRYKEVLRYLLPIIILTDVTKNAIRISPISDWDLLPPHKTLFGNDHGLPIGNITSQLFANFYLSDMDHLAKSANPSYERYVDDIFMCSQSYGRLVLTRKVIASELRDINMKLNERKSTIREARYGVDFLGVKIRPYYSTPGNKKIGRLYYTTRFLRNAGEAYASCSSRKGVFDRYHGRHLAMRWYLCLPETIREDLKIDTNARFHLTGERALPDKTKPRSIRLYVVEKGEQTCTTSSMRTAS